jgi:hypothetical protein
MLIRTLPPVCCRLSVRRATLRTSGIATSERCTACCMSLLGVPRMTWSSTGVPFYPTYFEHTHPQQRSTFLA